MNRREFLKGGIFALLGAAFLGKIAPEEEVQQESKNWEYIGEQVAEGWAEGFGARFREMLDRLPPLRDSWPMEGISTRVVYGEAECDHNCCNCEQHHECNLIEGEGTEDRIYLNSGDLLVNYPIYTKDGVTDNWISVEEYMNSLSVPSQDNNDGLLFTFSHNPQPGQIAIGREYHAPGYWYESAERSDLFPAILRNPEDWSIDFDFEFSTVRDDGAIVLHNCKKIT